MPIPTLSDKATQILKGAMQEFLKQGYTGTSMDKIAQAAGVSKQTLYSYFQDKESLFLALAEHLAKKRFVLVFGAMPLDGEPQQVLRQFAQQMLKQIINDWEYLAFIRLVFAESGRFPEVGRVFAENIAKPGTKAIATYLASHPELNLPDPEEAASAFLGALLHYIITQEIMNVKEVIPRSPDRMINNLVYLLTRR